jgi:hypothetical protein
VLGGGEVNRNERGRSLKLLCPRPRSARPFAREAA